MTKHLVSYRVQKLSFARTLLLHLLLTSLFVSIHENFIAEPESRQIYGNQERINKYYEKAKDAYKILPKLEVKGEDQAVHISVWYLEHLLSSWVLERAPWNAYHSGIGFIVEKKSKKKGNKPGKKEYYAVDFSPRVTQVISAVLHPTIVPRYPEWMPVLFGRFYSQIFASYDLIWENEGTLRYYSSFPEKFTNMTFVGEITPAQFNHIREWFFFYQKNYTTFEPVEVILNDTKSTGMPSSMCHDLFYNALHELHKVGFKPMPQNPLIRDHIMVYAKDLIPVDISDWKTRREIVRYYKLFISFMPEIDQEFTNIRKMLAQAEAVNVTAFLYSNRQYFKIKVVKPWVNYCYLPLLMPPAKASIATDASYCALDMDGEQIEISFPTLLDYNYIMYYMDEIFDASEKVWICIFTLLVLSLAYAFRNAT